MMCLKRPSILKAPYGYFKGARRGPTVSPKNQALIQELRKLVKNCSLPLTETVKWGNGCWAKDDLPILYIHVLTDGVQFGFFAGSKISDPKELLEGKGKFVRFITIRSKEDIDTKYFATLIKRVIKVKYK